MVQFSGFARVRPFFNRKAELEGLRDLTWSGGRLLLVTGPRDSGKSSLVKEFAARMAEDRTGTPILIDMRAGTFSTAGAFARELKSQVLPFIQTARDLVKAVPVGSADPATSAALATGKIAADAFLNYAKIVEKQRPDDMTGLLKELHGLFFHWRVAANRFYGRQAGIPTLILDEANRLHEWSRDPQEMTHLKSLEAFFVKMTKQDEVGNVILCSSEDFFRFWMQSRLGYQRFMVEVVGDLVETEAKEFFLSRVNYKGDFPEDLWKEIYGYVGGRMLLLNDAALRMERSKESQEKLWEKWGLFKKNSETRCLAEVLAGFHPEDTPEKWTRPELGVQVSTSADQDAPLKACWTREAYKTVLDKLLRAEGGIVSEEELVESECITRIQLYSLSRHNFLHYRETSDWAKDVSWYKGPWPAIMSPSKPHYLAISKALAKC